MKIAVIIPARLKSTRFPEKPLAKIFGKPMIELVWSRCIKAIDKSCVYVATDSNKIKNFCETKDIKCIITSKNCLTGTDRVYEANKIIKADIVINVQGDEPLISPLDIKKIINLSKKSPDKILNAMCEINHEKDFRNLSIPKVVFSKKNQLIYMSRSPIPQNKKDNFEKAWKQVCIYAIPKKPLKDFYLSKKTPIEKIEDIEILRFLELGYQVKMIKVSESSIAVDFPNDIKKVENAIRKKSYQI